MRNRRRAPHARPFFDTSALVKRYVWESGSAAVKAIFGAATEIVVAPITGLEVVSAVARRLREGLLTGTEAGKVLRRLDRDWPDFARVRWSPQLERVARRMLSRKPLRTLDAIQLASARIARCRLLVSSDQRLLKVAGQEGFRLEAV